jgi:hypothetical protein
VLAPLLVAASLSAQTRTEKHSPLGLRIEVPRTYEPMPVSPDDPLLQVRYLGKESSSGLRPDLLVVKIPWGKDPDPLPDPPPVNSFERFLAQRMSAWKLDATKELQPIDGWVTMEHTLERLPPKTLTGMFDLTFDSPWGAWAIERQDGYQSWIVIGFCDKEDLAREVKLWRRVAEKLQFFTPTAAAEEKKWARYYQFHPEFRNGELRTKMRARLLDGWSWEDTPNFVFLMSSDKAVLMRDLQKKLEGIRKHYLARFPPAAEIMAVSTARVCEDEEEYLEYGGSQGTVGYWNAGAKELVFFENGKEDTRMVLYHEAFHQYVFYAVGEARPHPWFNEGYGDYFSGAEFNRQGDVLRIHPNSWRILTIQRYFDECPSWKEIVRKEQKDFMAKAQLLYPMAWSMVYFLEESKEVEKRPEWARILPTYYETFRGAWGKERERLAAAGTLEEQAEAEMGAAAAREAAVSAAFAGVDMAEIESAWQSFVLELKLPK